MAKKRIFEIDRRTFLQGLGASVVSLPMFDFFLNSNGTAFAQTGQALPKRFLLMMNGISLTRNNKNINNLQPAQTGRNYELTGALAAMADFPGVKDHITLLSNLSLPHVFANSSSNPPPGGYKGAFHNVAARTQLTGNRTGVNGASADRILQAQLNSSGKYLHMNYCVQARAYLGTSTGRAITQFKANGDRIVPQQSPRAAFNELFFNLQESDPEQEKQRQLAAAKRKSVLDLISRERIEFLNRELGTKEKAMLTDHFDRIRDIEKSLENIQDDVNVTCRKPAEPTDPPLGANYIGSIDRGSGFDTNIAYSNEDLRANIFIDLIAMAMTCDIARHGTLRLTYDQSYMSGYQISGARSDYHEMTHYQGTDDQFMRMVRWHLSKYCRMVDKLMKTPEGSGTVLDNSALIFASEGGGGRNSDDGGNISPHSGHNMATMIAGHAGGLKAMGHIRTSEVHPSRVILSGMRAVGYTGNALGEVSGIITELF